MDVIIGRYESTVVWNDTGIPITIKDERGEIWTPPFGGICCVAYPKEAMLLKKRVDKLPKFRVKSNHSQ